MTECEALLNKFLDGTADLRARVLTYERRSGAMCNRLEEIFVNTWTEQTRLFANLRQLLDDSNDKFESVRTKLGQVSLKYY